MWAPNRSHFKVTEMKSQVMIDFLGVLMPADSVALLFKAGYVIAGGADMASPHCFWQ
jgi:hypothetical protein